MGAANPLAAAAAMVREIARSMGLPGIEGRGGRGRRRAR
jgi:hypothetical protein